MKIWAALAAVAAVLVAASFAIQGRADVKQSGGDEPVDAGARNPGDIDANNSPALARNPRRPQNLAVSNRIDTPTYSCALHVSPDGGRSWHATHVPIPAGEEPKCYAPDVAFGPEGTLYMSYVTLRGTGNRPHAVWVARSEDGGRTLEPPVQVAGPLAFQVRLAADPVRPSRVYVTWLQASAVGIFLFAGPVRLQARMSIDRGRHWAPPAPVGDPRRERVLAPAPAVERDGSLDVLYLDVDGDRLDFDGAHGGNGGPPYDGRFTLVLARSSDLGATWRESTVDDNVTPVRRFIAFLPPFPSLAIGRDGRRYVAFEDGAGGGADVHLWTLAPGVRRWTGPVQVNDTPSGDSSWQYMPAVAVAPDGRVDVVYYDRQRDRTNRLSDVSLRSSFDDGRTFRGDVTLNDRRFDSGIGAGSERALPDLGNRLGLVADDDETLASWTDTRSGTVDSNKQDIAFARARVVHEHGLPDGLRYGAVVLLIAAGLLWWARR